MTFGGYGRYAIYAAPSGALGRFGTAWLGWDAEAGQTVPHPAIAGLPRPADKITRTPRKYGFHGTLKPPFRLADGQSTDALDAALGAFCAAQTPVDIGHLSLTRIGPFLALTPDAPVPALTALAGTIVRRFDGFRAPLTEAELDRRRAAGLTAAQEALLVRWGYPYVMEEFRFHLTLTGPLPEAEAEAAQAALAPALAPLLADPYRLDDLSLFGERKDGRFHLLKRYRLTAGG